MTLAQMSHEYSVNGEDDSNMLDNRIVFDGKFYYFAILIYFNDSWNDYVFLLEIVKKIL